MSNFIWENLFRDSKKENSVREKLKKNYLFQDLNLSELKFLERIVNVRDYRAGENIFRQGDVGVGMYLIAKGSVNIYVEEIVPQTGEAKMALVTQLKAGDFFGDLALVEDNGRRSATAVSHQEVSLIGFFKSDLIEITERSSAIGVKILMRLSEVLGRRLKETTQKITELRREYREKGFS